MTAIILIGSKTNKERDLTSFLTPEPNDVIIHIEEDSDITLGPILKQLGIFKSLNEARRNNWDRFIPSGYSHYRVGKLKHEVHILKKNGTYPHEL